MLSIAWQTIRSRPARFAGTFVALALGVALIAATGLVIAARRGDEVRSRYNPGNAVVTADPRLDAAVIGAPPGVPPSTVGVLAGLSSVDRVVADRSIEIVVGPIPVSDARPRGHGWSSAGFGPYRLASGRPPSAGDEIVVDGRLANAGGWRTGDSVRVLAESADTTYRVVGVTAPVATTEAVVFFSDERAAALSSRVAALVVVPAAGARLADVAAAIRERAPGLRVLTGARVRESEPDPVGDAYEETATLLGLMASISGFVSVFVVASTFALAIAQRRRELALLRVVGATPRQIRRMVLAEAAVVGVAAAGVGCVLALPVGYALIGLMRRLHVAPPHIVLALTPVPLVVAAGVGLVVALLGVWFAARRTRRVRPVEALRQADVEPRSMTVSRWLIGLVATAGGVTMLAATGGANADGRTPLVLLVGQVLVIGAAALAPVLVRPAVRLVALPLRRIAGITAEVAAANLRAQPRRTAATAAPVLVMVGIAGSFLTATTSLEHSVANEQRAQTAAELVLTPATTPGLTGSAVAEASTVDGVADVAPLATTHVYLRSPGGVEEYSTTVVPASAIARGALRFTVTAGDLADLHGDAFAAGTSLAADRRWHLGEVVPLYLDDGTEGELRLVATVDGGVAGGSVFVPADRAAGHLGPWGVTSALVTLVPGADSVAVRRTLAARLADHGATVLPREQWLARIAAVEHEGIRIGLVAFLGLAAVYTAIAIVNTLVMAVREREQDLAQLRLAGATYPQALRTLLCEGALVAAVGILLGGLVTAVTRIALPETLRAISTTAEAVVPWSTLVTVAGICAALAVGVSLAAGAVALRRSPLHALAVPE